jgi:hypothetical protein
MEHVLHELFPREDNGYSRGRRALVVTAVLTSIAALIVGMRLFARLGLMKVNGREDWAILVSLVWRHTPMLLPISQLIEIIVRFSPSYTFP